MNVLPWLGWTWLLVIGAEGIYLPADFFFGPWLPPATVLPSSDVNGSATSRGFGGTGESAVLGLVIALVVANSLFIAALRQFGDDKPAITKFALFLAASFVLVASFVGVHDVWPLLAGLMLWIVWAGISITYCAFGVIFFVSIAGFGRRRPRG